VILKEKKEDRTSAVRFVSEDFSWFELFWL